MTRNSFRGSPRLAWIILALLICGAMPSHADPDFKKLATDLSTRIQAMKRSRVSVVEFADLDSKSNKLGRYLAQQLQAALAEPEYKLVVVDQSHIPQLFDQAQKLSEGLLDPATQQQLGQLMNTEVLIVGTVMPSSMTVRLNVKAIDLQTAKMISGGSSSLARIGIVEALAADATGGGATSNLAADSGEASSATSKPQKAMRPPARIVRDMGVMFELNECAFSGATLTCKVTVTSDRDGWLALHLDSRAWNDTGDEFQAGEVKIANSISDRSCAAKQILKNVPTPITLSFPEFEGETAVIERLRLAWAGSNSCWGDTRPVDFEKIALSESASPFSPRTNARPSLGLGEALKGGGKPGAGLLNRLGSRLMDVVVDAAEGAIDKQACKLAGNSDEECEKEKDPPQP